VSRWLPELRRGSHCVVGVDRETLAWHSATAGQRVSKASRANGLATLVTETRCTEIEFIAGNDIAVHWLQQPPASAASLRELRLVAAARCAHLHGGSPADWWVAGDWDSEAAFICCALPRDVVDNLNEQLRAARLEARWTSAWLAGCTARAASLRDNGWNALRTSAGATLWHARAGRIDCIVPLAAGPDTDMAQLQEQAERQIVLESARDGALGPGPLHWESCGSREAGEAAAILSFAGGLQ